MFDRTKTNHRHVCLAVYVSLLGALMLIAIITELLFRLTGEWNFFALFRSLVALAGVLGALGFALDYQLLSKQAWQVWFVTAISWSAVRLVSGFSAALSPPQDPGRAVSLVVIGVLIPAPVFVAVFLYAFKRRWHDSRTA